MTAIDVRHPVSGLGALVAMGALFYSLWVVTQKPPEIPTTHPKKIEFTPLIVDTKVIPTPNKQPPKPKPTPNTPHIDVGHGVGEPESFLVPKPADPKVDGPGFGTAGGIDRAPVPLIRLDPVYPRRAMERGIEGWVQLQITITAAGTVRDVIVIDADPKGHFEDAALSALSRWNYQPNARDGRASERPGVRVVLRFNLDNER